MTTTALFKDALDYLFIENGNAPDSFLLSNEVTSDRDVAASAAIFMSNSSGTDFLTNAAAAATTVALAAASASAPSSSLSPPASSSAVMENPYGSMAIGLSTLYFNDSLLSDANTTSVFGLLANGSTNLRTNLSTHGTADDAASEDIAGLVRMAATSIVLGLMILITIIGNVFVIAAIILERNLQNVANYLVASLAVADLFVACLVMPLGAVYEISQGWILGPELCDIWTSCDVLCCTASILHLVAIATDRYWAVTNIDYMHSRTSRRIFLMIFCVWFAAVIVSLAPQFGWKDPDYLQRIEQQKCMVSQDVAYQVFATCCTFYVPLLVILGLYWKIYQTARKRIHRRRPRPINAAANNNQPDLSPKKRKRLRLRIGKSSAAKGKSGAALGLVEGNSTNTVNTVEDTEFSSSNVDSKSRAGVEVTTVLSCTEEAPTSSASQISTVSHLVALANQQQQQLHCQHNATAVTTTATTSRLELNQSPHSTPQLQQHLCDHHHQQQHQQQQPSEPSTKTTAIVNGCTTATLAAAATTPPTITAATTTTTTDKSLAAPATTNAADSSDIMEDHQLQQQLQEVTAAAAAATNNKGKGDVVVAAGVTSAGVTSAGVTCAGVASASAATTITSISALSPQTPLNAICGASMPTAAAAGTTATISLEALQPQAAAAIASNQVTPLPHVKQPHQNLASIPNPHSKVTKRKETLEAKRERKAAKTLAIITGAFVVCWLPFFVMALLLPLCNDCEINDALASFFLWMGYFNSTLNPVIYTIFSPEFRQAFKRILFGGHRPVHYRSGKI